jgi:hypothetical protein
MSFRGKEAGETDKAADPKTTSVTTERAVCIMMTLPLQNGVNKTSFSGQKIGNKEVTFLI